LKAANKSDDELATLGDNFHNYAKQFDKEFTTFCKNDDNKEQLQTELTSGKIAVRIVGDDKEDVYWVIEEGTLWMETKARYWNSWLSSFTVELLEKKLGAEDPQPLVTRKNVKAAKVKQDATMTKVNAVFGKELAWVDNVQELYDTLKKSGKSVSDLYTIGDNINSYTDQLLKEFTTFCKDADNKEALDEELSAGQVGVRIVDDSKEDKYWVLEDGTLWMETKARYWNSWLSSFTAEVLEKIL